MIMLHLKSLKINNDIEIKSVQRTKTTNMA